MQPWGRMNPVALHEFHGGLGAGFTEVNGQEVVAHYGDWVAELAALHGSVGVADLSFRGRVCLTGADRTRFLNVSILAMDLMVAGRMEQDPILSLICSAF